MPVLAGFHGEQVNRAPLIGYRGIVRGAIVIVARLVFGF